MLLSAIFFALGIVSLLLIIIVLLQDSKAGGLSTAFGGGGGDTLLGASGQTELAKFTVYLVLAFFALALVGGIMGKSDSVLADDEPEPGIESLEGGDADGTGDAGTGETGGTDTGGTDTGGGDTGSGDTGGGEGE